MGEREKKNNTKSLRTISAILVGKVRVQKKSKNFALAFLFSYT